MDSFSGISNETIIKVLRSRWSDDLADICREYGGDHVVFVDWLKEEAGEIWPDETEVGGE